MSKSILTNCIAILLVVLGFFLKENHLLQTGLYAFSGSITNWLAVHMLFEKIPFLYGSGIIPNRFTEFKVAIKHLIMEQFFTEHNISKFFKQENTAALLPDFDSLIAKLNLDKLFQGLIDMIMESSLGSMVSMVGGPEVFETLRSPFKEKFAIIIHELINETDFSAALAEHPNFLHPDKIIKQVELVVDERLNELTPQMVKVIIQEMIKKHLGWLVVWGGVFGGLIGLLVSFTTH